MSREAIDARPFLRASADSLWARAESGAQSLVLTLKEELAQLNIEAAVTRSPNGTHPTVVRVDAWMPPAGFGYGGRTVRRLAVSFTCKVHPFNRTKLVFDVGISRDIRGRTIAGLLDFNRDEARAWLRYALGIGKNPRGGEIVAHHLLSRFGLAMLSPRHNPFDSEFRNGFPPPLPVIMAWLGLLSIGGGIALMQSSAHDDAYRYPDTYPVPESYPYADPVPAAPYTEDAAPPASDAPAYPAETPPADYPAAPAEPDYSTPAYPEYPEPPAAEEPAH